MPITCDKEIIMVYLIEKLWIDPTENHNATDLLYGDSFGG